MNLCHHAKFERYPPLILQRKLYFNAHSPEAIPKGSVIFLLGGGLLKIGGIRYFFLDQKRGSKDFSN